MPNYDLPGVEALREMAADDSGSIFAPKSELDDFRQVFLDRELSWLAFDHRVMLEAAERRCRCMNGCGFSRSGPRIWMNSIWCAWADSSTAISSTRSKPTSSPI